MPSHEGIRRHNLDLSSLKPRPQKKEVGSGVKNLENRGTKQSGVPENREHWNKLRSLVAERALNYHHTATRIMEERASQSSKHDPEELLRVAELISMRAIGLGEALSIIGGKDEEHRNLIEEMEESFPNYTNIVAEFSDEKKSPNT
jgi:hypothetical protein